MGKYVVENLIKNLIKANVSIKDAKVAILGFTFKENCPDTRNTRIIDIVNELKEYGIIPKIADPQADEEEAYHEYGINFAQIDEIKELDALIIAVAHSDFLDLAKKDIDRFYKSNNGERVLIDIKGIYNKLEFEKDGYRYWRL